MSTSYIVGIVCDTMSLSDNCHDRLEHEWQIGMPDMKMLRTQAKEAGWIRKKVDGRMGDVCPGCAKIFQFQDYEEVKK